MGTVAPTSCEVIQQVGETSVYVIKEVGLYSAIVVLVGVALIMFMRRPPWWKGNA